ncbi:MAG: glycine-rich domain-containing protein [Planctomycetaceae bacterium]
MTLLETATRTLPESIANLDLGDLGRKLLDDDAFDAERRNGERLWDEQRVACALNEYKQFLALMYWNPEAVLVPSEDIDEVWHTHVLNTARYQAECETIFGHFQHHCPTFGESHEVQEEQAKGRDKTMKLFEETFGEVPQSYTFSDYRKCGRRPKCGNRPQCGRM